MDYNNETKRLEGHEPMKEIPESFEEYKPVAATVSYTHLTLPTKRIV